MVQHVSLLVKTCQLRIVVGKCSANSCQLPIVWVLMGDPFPQGLAWVGQHPPEGLRTKTPSVHTLQHVIYIFWKMMKACIDIMWWMLATLQNNRIIWSCLGPTPCQALILWFTVWSSGAAKQPRRWMSILFPQCLEETQVSLCPAEVSLMFFIKYMLSSSLGL